MQGGFSILRLLINASGQHNALKNLPIDLFGLVPEQKTVIQLPDTLSNLTPAPKDVDERIMRSSTAQLLEILNLYCILPSIAVYDGVLQKLGKYTKLYSKKAKDVEARTIVRGAAMDALVRATGGDESILATKGAHSVLIDSWQHFYVHKKDSPERVSKRIKEGTLETLHAFTGALAAQVSANPLLSSLLHEQAKLIIDRVFPNTDAAASTKKSPQPRKRKTSAAQKLRTCPPTSLGDILPSGELPSTLAIASILREACNRARNFPPADGRLFKVLIGQEPSSQKQYPPEQTDPIRYDNAYTKLLLEHIPPVKLATCDGASALLTYMGTGQCTATRGFLQSNQGIFWDHDECVSAFETAKSKNSSVSDTNPSIEQAERKGKKHRAFIEGMVQFQCPQVWGQPCCHLSVPEDIGESLSQCLQQLSRTSGWSSWAPCLGKHLVQCYLVGSAHGK